MSRTGGECVVLLVDRRRNHLGRHHITYCQHNRALHHISQLSDVSGPVISQKKVHTLSVKLDALYSVLVAYLVGAVLTETAHILLPMAPCRYVELNDIDPIEQILPETAGFDLIAQNLVRCRDKADVHLDLLLSTHSSKRAGFNGTKELDLDRERHLTDFVQEQSSFIGQFKAALLSGVCPCKRPLLVPEKFTLDKLRRDRTTVDIHHRLQIGRASCRERGRTSIDAVA